MIGSRLGKAGSMDLRTQLSSAARDGLGRATARKLTADGFHVVAVGRRRAPLEDLASELGPRADVVEADLATEAGAAAVAAEVESAGRGCAGVVAAAGGISSGSAPEDASSSAGALATIRQDWQACFESNVLTAVLLVEALHKQIEHDGGRVVLISSVAALRGSGVAADGAWRRPAGAFDLPGGGHRRLRASAT